MAKEYLLVDGYNIIFSWDELRSLAKENLESARFRIADILCNYQGFHKNEIILVFDGYKSKGNSRNIIRYHNIDIVYTKEAETADQFIEMVSKDLARHYKIKVATSDRLEQVIILGSGAARISARELKIEIEETKKSIRETCETKIERKRNGLFDNLSDEMSQLLENMRLDKEHKG